MTKLAVVGPGLLGGSIALAARRTGNFTIRAWARRPEAVEELRAGSFAELASSNLEEIVHDADLVVLCVPIGAMPTLAREMAPFLRPDTLVTDVGSVKGPVVKEIAPIFDGHCRFIGSHPMAGSEQTGLVAARAELFDGAVCILTPDECCTSEDIERARAFWMVLGCQVKTTSPSLHDEYVAAVSHFPHLLASVLINAVEDQLPDAFEYCGPGFRDTTRVASGPTKMWAEILHANAGAVKKSAEAMIEKLREAITLLDFASAGSETQMNEFLTKAKARRDAIAPAPKPQAANTAKDATNL